MPALYDLVLSRGPSSIMMVSAKATSACPRAGSPQSVGSRRGRGPAPSTAAGCIFCPASSTPMCISASPALEHKEDLQSGSRAAVMGGVTAVFEMPNTQPPTISAEAQADKVRRADNPHVLRFRLLSSAAHERECQGCSAAREASRLLPASRCSWDHRPATPPRS